MLNEHMEMTPETRPAADTVNPIFIEPDNRILAFIAHISLLLGLYFIGPIIILLINTLRHKPSSFVRSHSLQALLFHAVLFVIGILIAIIVVKTTILSLLFSQLSVLLLAGLTPIAISVAGLILFLIFLKIRACVLALKGHTYAYPFMKNISFLKVDAE